VLPFQSSSALCVVSDTDGAPTGNE
jgi:hypothetical protein